MPSIDQGRVVEIVAIGKPENRSGTGYLLGDGCVLTAQHVIKGHKNQQIKCRQLSLYNNGQKERTVAEVVWEDADLDLALLRVVWRSDTDVYLPKVRKLDWARDVMCRAYGFPKFMKEEQHDVTIYNPYVAQGWIKPLTPKKAGEILLDLKGSNPGAMDGWKGISGAAIFSEDGYLIGVVTEGPEALSGGLLKGVSIESVIAADPTFAALVEKYSQQKLQCLDVEQAQASEIFDLELKLAALTVNKEVSATRYKLEIEDTQDRLSKLDQTGIDATALSSLPKGQLLSLLSEIEAISKEFFWEAWRCSPASNVTKNNIPVKQAYAILWNLKDTSQVHHFLSILYQLIERQDYQSPYLEPLSNLTETIFGHKIEQTSVLVQESETDETSSSLLVRLKSTSSPGASITSYALTIWLVKNRQAYQARIKASESQADSLSGYSEKLVDGVSIEVAASDLTAHSQDIKHELSEIFTELWENSSLGLQKLLPEVVFCVPMQLFETDFQNIELGELSVLGLELPVSVSCLERYESETLSKYKQSWIDRWQVLEDYYDEHCSCHIETHDGDAVDITCPRKLHKWLLQKDGTRKPGRRVAGMGFYLPYSGLSKVFRNLIINGLPVIFWPKHTLNEKGVSGLRNSLKVIPSNTLVAIKNYRISSEDDDAGPVSILLDNPYLPPPDYEIDYY